MQIDRSACLLDKHLVRFDTRRVAYNDFDLHAVADLISMSGSLTIGVTTTYKTLA